MVLNESLINRTRMTTGLVMFTYVLGHLLDHANGVISVGAMQAWLHYMILIWGNPVGDTLLYGSLLIHISLALRSLWLRRSLRMPAMEAAQFGLGFLIPVLLADHIAGTRLALGLYDASVDYRAQLLWFYVLAPMRGLEQVALLIAAWTHACIGLNYSLRLKSWYGQGKWLLFAGALLVPALALIGFFEGGREVATLAQDPTWISNVALKRPLPPGGTEHLDTLGDLIRGIALGLLAAVLAGRVVRARLQYRHGAVIITYPNRRRVRILPGTSVLEASREASIPHASICGGRGRCTTCRIRVIGPMESIPEPSDTEIRVLHGIGAPPNVRLACQLRPTGDIEVTPLLSADVTASEGVGKRMDMQGMELEIAILFCDIRSFTHLAERMLPYDVVFLLNRYFAETGRAVEEAGGRVDKFLGDGVMALFGVERGPAEGCRAGLAAARAISERLDHLNAVLQANQAEPIRIGMGLHVGRVIVGEMGYGRTVSVTAIGDAVNTASRLETETKQFGVELVVSEDVARHAGIDLGAYPCFQIDIRGRDEKLEIRTVMKAKELPAFEPARSGGAEKTLDLAAQPG
jgi:adenylate cyclase